MQLNVLQGWTIFKKDCIEKSLIITKVHIHQSQTCLCGEMEGLGDVLCVCVKVDPVCTVKC